MMNEIRRGYHSVEMHNKKLIFLAGITADYQV
jgi:hypothetical protein